MTAVGDAPDFDSVDVALEQIHRTHGHVPGDFRRLADHTPETVLGYVGLRELAFRAAPETMKEFVSVLLDIQAGNIRGARNLEIAGETKPSAS